MATTLVGVDIGDSALRAIEVQNPAKPRPTVLRYHEVALPPGAVRSGEVAEPNTVATALRSLWSEGRFRSKRVVLGLGNQKVIARELTVPRAPLARIRGALPYQVQELLPVPVADAVLDFYPVAEIEGEQGPAVSGLLIAAVKEAVLANVHAVRQAGLDPVDVDLIPFALQRALVAPSPGSTAVVDVGATTTSVLVATNGVPQFVRIIPAGGDDVTAALTARLEMPHDQAFSLKSGLGMAVGSVPPEYHSAVEVIYDVTRELLNSVRNTLNYFVNTRPGVTVERIVLTGGGAQLPGFSVALAELSRTPVEFGDPFAGVQVDKEVQALAASTRRHCASVALGLAIGRAA